MAVDEEEEAVVLVEREVAVVESGLEKVSSGSGRCESNCCG